MVFLLAFLLVPWDRIDVHCVVRDAAGRPASNLRAEQLQVFDAGELRPVISVIRETEPPDIVRIDNPASLYPDALLAITRRFQESSTRKILVISGLHSGAMAAERRWELVLLALRLHVVVYGIGPADNTVVALAEETGGRIAPNWNAIQADLDAQYHIVATPLPHAPGTGLLHQLEIRAPQGWRVQAPRNYYIAPPWDED